MKQADKIITTILKYYPAAQAIYLFGSHGTADARPDSDVDIGVLLAPGESREAGSLVMSDLRFELESLLKRNVDLINLREVPTVLQKEIVMTEGRIYQADEYAADEFEMLTISNYQKLNEERAGILREVIASGRFYNQ